MLCGSIQYSNHHSNVEQHERLLLVHQIDSPPHHAGVRANAKSNRINETPDYRMKLTRTAGPTCGWNKVARKNGWPCNSTPSTPASSLRAETTRPCRANAGRKLDTSP